MKKANKWVVLVLALLTVATFIIYIFPNKAASENHAMVGIFEPDEGATYSVIDRMTSPKPDLRTWMKSYITYEFYHYGFPFFSISSLPAYVARWTNQYTNTSFVMASLRQFVNVLPSLIAILILIYMQDQFSSYKSIILFIILASVPAVFKNSMWWHPDGLVLIFSVLTLFFLWKDEHRFGKFFYVAAIFAGILTATKLIGVFFLAAIVPLLLWEVKEKRISIKTSITKWLVFALLMSCTFLISNPFLFTIAGVKDYLRTLYLEYSLISKGYDLVYTKGFAAAWQGMQPFYGSLPFYLTIVFSFYLGFRDKAKQKLSFLLLCWLLPLTFTVLFTTHFKYQYWLPAALPAFSMLYMLLPDKKHLAEDKLWLKICKFALLAVVAIQLVFFNIQNVKTYNAQLHHQDSSESIRFYKGAKNALEPTLGDQLNVYYDYRVYLPPAENVWKLTTAFEIIDYPYLEEKNFDILLLINQRVRDYLNPNAEGVNKDKLETARILYRDVRDNSLRNYKLVFEDVFGKVFMREDLYDKYYAQP